MDMQFNFPLNHNCTVAVIGLGYVGLPLAVEIATTRVCKRTQKELNRRVIGFDINKKRLEEIRDSFDRNNEVSTENLKNAKALEFTDDILILSEADVYIITVPTPIDKYKIPNLKPLEKASQTIGLAIKRRSESSFSKENKTAPFVIYESTVYPGATEEICVPIIEHSSNQYLNRNEPNKGFFCGYSPERINPGDPNRKIKDITKVTSGSSYESAQWVDDFYGSIIDAGTHLASSIKVAEAAKIIENTQRDLNIALVNELAIIFNKLEIDTLDVLEAASTKWNFLNFKPGLVGGHCIGVDPYYLTFKAQELGYSPQVVLAGRRINDSIGYWIIERLITIMARKELKIGGSKILIMGLTFKENCPDLRNTKVIDLIKGLKHYGMEVIVVDPCADIQEAYEEYGIELFKEIPKEERYAGVIVSVAHEQFKRIKSSEWGEVLTKEKIIFDLKGIVPRDLNPIRV